VGAPAPSRRRKKFKRNLHGKFVTAPQHTKCTPSRAIVNFRTFLEVGVVNLVILDRLLGATTKKGRQLF